MCRQAGLCLILKAAEQISPKKKILGGGEVVSPHTVLDELIASKTAGNRRKVYTDSLRYYLSRFLEKIGKPSNIGSISAAQIEGFISTFQGYTRQTWLNRISTLFSFAVRREYIERNPCNQIDRIKIDRKPPMVLTAEQAKTLRLSCPTICKPYLILGMYVGVRPDEIRRMTWADINLETGAVKVNGKTRQRRIVYLEAVALKYLLAHPLKSGPVAPSKHVTRRWARKQRPLLGGKWPADILRHTAASYLLAKYQDVGKVAMMLGNSPQILLRHYHDPVTKEESKKFWEECQTMSAAVRLEPKGGSGNAEHDGKTNGENNTSRASIVKGTNGGTCPKGATQLELDGRQGVQNAA